MRALAPEVGSSRPNGELSPVFSRLIQQARTNLIQFSRMPLKAINKLHPQKKAIVPLIWTALTDRSPGWSAQHGILGSYSKMIEPRRAAHIVEGRQSRSEQILQLT